MNIKKIVEELKKFDGVFFIYAVFAASILGYFSKFNFLFDICSHFRMQYLFFGLIILIFCIIRKKKTVTSLLVLLIVVSNIFPVLGAIKTLDHTKKQGFTIEIINILSSNEKYDEAKKELLGNSPDIIVIEELDDEWSERLQPIKENYPYIYEISRDDNLGIALYSKIHISQIRKLNLGSMNTPAISAFCDYDGKVFELICAHVMPPFNQECFNSTKKTFEELARYVVENGHNVIIVGDFNSTPYSYNYKNFLKISQMKDLSNIFHPTWPTFWFPPFRITLDHIFITKAFAVKDYSVQKNIGSDHCPVWAEISFKE